MTLSPGSRRAFRTDVQEKRAGGVEHIPVARRSAAALALAGLLLVAASTALAADCGMPPGTERCSRWVAKTEGQRPGPNIANATVVSPDGTRLFVTGAAQGSSDQDIGTFAYDAATGALLWRAYAPLGGSDQGKGIAVSADGETVFVVGDGTGTFTDITTIAYNAATGEERWMTQYDARGLSDIAIAIGLSRDGERAFVTGYSDSGSAFQGGTEYDYATIAYDTTAGEQVWIRRYDGPAHFWDIVQDLAVARVQTQGGYREVVAVTGRSNGQSTANNHTDYATVAYDGATGEELWTSRYDGSAGDREYAYAITASDDGSTLFVTGESVSSGTSYDYATVAYDALTGASLWAARLPRPLDDRPLGVAESNGRVYVTGFGMNGRHPVDRSVVTVAYEASSGTQLWKSERTGPLGEAGRDVWVSPDGTRVYVGGLSAGLVFGSGVYVQGLPGASGAIGISAFMTVAYDASGGTEQWVAHHGGFATDASSRGSALSPDGSRFFITGGEAGSYTTVAYDTA